MAIPDICLQLRKIIEKSVRMKNVDAMLFSAGLDTTVLAYEASKYRKSKLVTVLFKSYGLDEVNFIWL